MALHQSQNTGLVLEITHVTELVDLVIADGLVGQQALVVLLIVPAGGHDGHACTGEGDLRCGGEFIDHIGVALLPAEGQNVTEGDKFAVDLVDAVGVVPHEGKVRRGGTESGDSIHHGIAVDDALRVGILGDAPHTLDRRVPDRFFHRIHIGAVSRHGNGNHFHAKGGTNLEMPVIAGGRTEEFHSLFLAPGTIGMKQSMGIGLGDQVVHQVQAGVAADEDLLRIGAEKIGKQTLGRRDTGQLAVIAHVNAAVHAVGGVGQDGQHIADQVQLGLAGLPAGHIQGKSPGPEVAVTFTQGGKLTFALRSSQLRIGFHHHCLLKIKSICAYEVRR